MWWLLEPENLRRFALSALLLRRHVRKHPRLYGVALLLVLLAANGYFALYHFYIQPARDVVSTFYHAIDNEQYELAWSMLDDDLKRKWDGGFPQFRRGYVTTVKHTDMHVSDFLSLRQLLDASFSRSMHIDVQFRVIDRFDRESLDDQMQEHNRLALQLRHPTEYEQLINGTLPNDMTTVELTRRYQRTATVTHKQGQWRISSFQSKSMGFEYERR